MAYLGVEVQLAADVSCIQNIFLKDGGEVEGQNIHPLLEEMTQLEKGDFVGLLYLFKKGIKDPDFKNSVSIRHQNMLPDLAYELHAKGAHWDKGCAHQCFIKEIIPLLERQVEIQNMSKTRALLHQIEQNVVKGARWGLAGILTAGLMIGLTLGAVTIGAYQFLSSSLNKAYHIGCSALKRLNLF